MRRPYLVINTLEEHGDEDETQKIAATIKEETGISQNTVLRNLDKTSPILQVDKGTTPIFKVATIFGPGLIGVTTSKAWLILRDKNEYIKIYYFQKKISQQ